MSWGYLMYGPLKILLILWTIGCTGLGLHIMHTIWRTILKLPTFTSYTVITRVLILV